MNDGGPAFPIPQESQAATWSGMTLRDYFADSAMRTLLRIVPACPNVTDREREWIAQGAFLMADSMLKAREAK